MNINQHLQGKTVTSLVGIRSKRMSADFPGWGAENYADFLIPTPDGLVGVITSVNSHGSAPFTRYCVRWEDGSQSNDLTLNEHIVLAD